MKAAGLRAINPDTARIILDIKSLSREDKRDDAANLYAAACQTVRVEHGHRTDSDGLNRKRIGRHRFQNFYLFDSRHAQVDPGQLASGVRFGGAGPLNAD